MTDLPVSVEGFGVGVAKICGKNVLVKENNDRLPNPCSILLKLLIVL